MFNGSGLSTFNYNSILSSWGASTTQRNVTLGALGIRYRPIASDAHDHLVNDQGWNIIDGGLAPYSAMKLTIDTSIGGCTYIQLPIRGVRVLTVDWGDGLSEPQGDWAWHNYPSQLGTYQISLTGDADVFGQNGGWNGVGCVTSVDSFGDLGIRSLDGAFYGASNLITVPNSLPVTVTETSRMFSYAGAFNADLSTWDTSHVTNMYGMFAYANSFNQDLSGWDTSRVTNMAYMFDHATLFNSDLSTWNTSSVTDISRMFNSAVSFTGDVHTWDTSKVTLMSGMFADAQAFNSAIGNWNTSKVTAMDLMFYAARSFNQDIHLWNTAKVSDMSSMFQQASAFNQPLNSWNVSNLVSMNSMFLNAGSFNQDLSSWDVQNLQTATYAFYGSAFNHSLATWHLENLRSAIEFLSVTPMSPSNYADSLRGWAAWPATVRGVDYMSSNIAYSPSGTSAHQYLTDTLGWRLYDAGPTSKQPMTINIDTSLDSCETSAITLPIGGVITDDPVVDWGDGTVDRLNGTSVATHTYGAAGQYNVNVAGVFSHFGNTAGYVGANCITGISGWGESGVSDLSGAFKGATNLASLPTLPGAVTDLSSAFANNATFNLDMSSWDVSRVTNFSNMFAGSTSFNSDITGWNTSAATNMNGMFSGATSFNQDISVWDVSHVLSMNGMFNGATSFDHSLGAWHLDSVTSMLNDFARSSISELNWTLTLTGWATNIDLANDVAIDASGHTWLNGATEAHRNLIKHHGWVFTNDGGLVDIPVITAVPSGVHGDQSVRVSWRALTDAEKVGADIDQIVVAAFTGVGPEVATCSPATVTSLYCDVTGLTNGTAYTFKMRAHNRIGWSDYWFESAPVTPSTVTSPPSIASATRGNAQATVTWNAPANNGGAPILGYTVTAYAGGTLVAGKTCSPTPATGLTCEVTGLTNGTAYTFKVVASNLNGPSALSEASSPVTPASAPTAPAAPTVTRGDAKVTVTWVAPANGGSAITGYTVSTFAGGTLVAGKSCTPTPVTGVTCDVTGLTNGTAYTFTVKATNGVGSGADSTASLAATPATVPAAPAAPSVVKGDAKVTVTWVAPANNGSAILSYTVTTYAGGTLVAGKTCSPNPATGLTCDVTGLTNGTAYTFKVKATNEVGPGADSIASAAATPLGAPASAAAPTVTRGNAQVVVAWVAPANGGSAITGYTVAPYAAGTLVTGKACTPSPVTALTCTVTGLTNGTEYTFKVKATNAIGSTESAASAAIIPAIAPTAPAAPTVVKGNLSVQVTWVAPANGGSAITGYTVSTYAGGTLVTGKTCTPSPATATTCVVTGLTNGTAYTFKVKATNVVNSSDDSAASAAVTPAAVPATPAAPTIKVGAAVGTGKATVTWVAPANNGSVITGFTATAYTAAGVSSGTCTTASATALTCSITGLTNGTAYTFKVTAKNANGTSFESPGATASPSATAVAGVAGTVPATPAAPTVKVGGTVAAKSAAITWVAPANGGSAITGYTVTASTGTGAVAGTCMTSGTAVTCSISGLMTGTTYTFTVVATNAVGNSAASPGTSGIPT
jgi:titin